MVEAKAHAETFMKSIICHRARLVLIATQIKDRFFTIETLSLAETILRLCRVNLVYRVRKINRADST